MADRKTHLRELGVGYCVYLLLNNIKADFNSLKISDFKILITKIYANDVTNGLSNINGIYFSSNDLTILNNALELAKLIVTTLPVKGHKIFWLGNETQKEDNIDLIIDDFEFSLKEESYILENMGLYKLINLITGSTLSSGKVHIFYDFAKEDFFKWFDYVWKNITQVENWELSKGDNFSKIYKKGDILVLEYNNKSCQLDINTTNYDIFTKVTNSKIREKVFSKWINENLSGDSTYIKLKKECSEKAGLNLVRFLNDNITYDSLNLRRLLQIYNKEYFYGKTTSKETLLFKVPGVHDFLSDIKIVDIQSSIPKSQLNLITTLMNKKTGKSLTLRNELRYSHGQFNGTPEAKMYYDKGSNLEIIYYPLHKSYGA